ncbi:MAG TPA: hypothetical protein VJ909_04310 [Prolixibacteraceae bacterium]|nr:hypothetical protein [Prolixibacteraceae bacterium]
MKEHTLNKEFNFYYNMLSEGQNKSLLSVMKSFINKSERISVEQYNKELDEAEKRIASGQFISHKSIKEESKEW